MSDTHLVNQIERKPEFISLRNVIYVFLTVSLVGITFSIAVSSIAMGAAIILWIGWIAWTKGAAFQRTPFDLFFVAYAVAEVLSTVFAVEPAASFVNMKRLFLISILYLVLLAIDSEFKLKLILGLLVGVSVVLTLVELFSVVTIGGHFERMSIFQYYLTEGGLKMILLLLLIPFIIHAATPKLWRILAAISAIILFLGLIVTQTRSSWLAFIGGVITIALLRSKKILIALILLIVLFVAFAPNDFRIRAASMFDPNMTSNLTRIHMITTGWRMFLDYPIVGTGDIDLKKLYVTYIVPIDDAEGGHLHNNVMMLLVTLGIVGFTATMAMFVKILLVELKAWRETKSHWLYGSVGLGAVASYIGFHINGLFEWNFGDHEIAVFLWFTVGIALVSVRLFTQTTN